MCISSSTVSVLRSMVSDRISDSQFLSFKRVRLNAPVRPSALSISLHGQARFSSTDQRSTDPAGVIFFPEIAASSAVEVSRFLKSRLGFRQPCPLFPDTGRSTFQIAGTFCFCQSKVQAPRNHFPIRAARVQRELPNVACNLGIEEILNRRAGRGSRSAIDGGRIDWRRRIHGSAGPGSASRD